MQLTEVFVGSDEHLGLGEAIAGSDVEIDATTFDSSSIAGSHLKEIRG